MTDETCGADTTGDQPCQNPAGKNGRCWIPSHNDAGAENPAGRPSKLTEETKEAVYAAVGSGLKLQHVASAAGVSPDTIRRWTCCIDDLRECILSADDPCDFCEGYAQAHASGAREVLDECRPEFRASASFGYTEKKEVDLEADVDQTTTHELGDDEKEVALETLRELQEAESE